MERIEVTSYEKNCKSVEYVLHSYELPFQKILGDSASGEKLFRYVTTAPDDIANTIVTNLTECINTKNKDTYVINERVEATVSDYLQELAEKLKQPKKVPQIIEELNPLTEPFVKFRKDLLVMIVIAAAVSLSGLYTDNAAVVIGAMLISPLLGPITAFSFNAAIGEPMRMAKSAVYGFLLILAVIASAAIISLGLSWFVELPITEEINLRTTTSPTDIVIGVLLGIAGGMAMVSSLPGILVGVAIAAALVPPAAVTGIGIAMLDPNVFGGAALLTSSNIMGLLIGCMIIFFLYGVNPRNYHEKEKARKYILVTIGMYSFIGIILTLVGLVY